LLKKLDNNLEDKHIALLARFLHPLIETFLPE
jgi:hypothetical protein